MNHPLAAKDSLMWISHRPDIVFTAGEGSWRTDHEGAIKLAREWGRLHKNGAYGIVTLDNGFHE